MSKTIGSVNSVGERKKNISTLIRDFPVCMLLSLTHTHGLGTYHTMGADDLCILCVSCIQLVSPFIYILLLLQPAGQHPNINEKDMMK